MADRYWVGGTGNWNDTARWSTSDGGGSGASVPTGNDDVYFTANSNTGTGAFTVTVNTTTRSCQNFTASGLDGVMTFAGSVALEIWGNLAIPASNFSWTQNGGIFFRGFSAQTITTNGQSIPGVIYFFQSGGSTHQLLDNFTASGAVSMGYGGSGDAVLDLNGYSITTPIFTINASGNKALTFGAGASINCTSTGTVFTGQSGTTIADIANAHIILSNTTSSARTFAGGGLTYGKLTIGGATGSSTLTITGSNTFGEIASTKTVAHTISFANGTTTTVGTWSVTGTAGNVVTLSSPGTWSIVSTGSALENVDFLTVSSSTATPADIWYAGTNGVNGGSNSGWIFTSKPDNFLSFFI